jgi:hypothetical protein
VGRRPPTDGADVTPEDWFEQLRAALPDEVPTVTDDERAALLDLARVAAHTSERWTAPVSTFLVGLAYADAARDGPRGGHPRAGGALRRRVTSRERTRPAPEGRPRTWCAGTDQRRPSALEHAGHAFQPCRSSRISARAICSAFEASCG